MVLYKCFRSCHSTSRLCVFACTIVSKGMWYWNSMAASFARRLRQGMGALMRHSGLFGDVPMIPKHVAFIMDGNRRFAKQQHITTAGGHSMGFDKVLRALEWCLDLGVSCVSIYAFSLENFRRSPSEVETLMQLAEDRMLALLQEDVVKRHGVRVRVLGDLTRVPPSVAHAAQQAMQSTAHHSSCLLNICLAYTSTDEVGRAMEAVQKQVSQGALAAGEVTLTHIEQRLYTVGCPKVDLVIRTSGETRLSDFLLQQSSAASLHFTSALWPQFSFTDLLAALCQFQREAPLVAALASSAAASVADAATALDDCATSAGPVSSRTTLTASLGLEQAHRQRGSPLPNTDDLPSSALSCPDRV